MPDGQPFMNEPEASAAARSVIPPEPGWSILSQSQHADLLHRALEAAGVEVSEFESRTAWWLSGWEDYTVSIIARWVRSAHETDRAGAFTEADVKPCRHCGGPLIPCRPAHEMPVCKGWKHAAWLSMGPVGPHYCEGRSVNPSGEPATGEGSEGDGPRP